MHFRWLALKGLPPSRILDDVSNSDKSKLPRVRKMNFLNVKSSKTSLNKTSKRLCNGIWQKQLLILKFEKGFFVDQTIFSWLQNMDQVTVKWNSKFEVVKISSRLNKVEKIASKSIVLIALDNKSTLPFILDNFHITMKYLECAPADDPMFSPVKTWVVEDSNGSIADWSINELVVELAAMSVAERVATSNS